MSDAKQDGSVGAGDGAVGNDIKSMYFKPNIDHLQYHKHPRTTHLLDTRDVESSNNRRNIILPWNSLLTLLPTTLL